MSETEPVVTIGRRQKPKLRQPPYAETDALVAAEVRLGLSVSWSHWYRVAPSLPVSYALGKQSPRYIWGEVLKFLRRTGAAA